MMKAEELAARHAVAFQDDMRAWSATEFKVLIENPHVHLIEIEHAFALTRIVVDEAEILTLATDPEHRRRGLGRALLENLETDTQFKGAKTVFLDVAETNTAARALYAAAGYSETGRRTAYYDTPHGRVDGLLLSKKL